MCEALWIYSLWWMTLRGEVSYRCHAWYCSHWQGDREGQRQGESIDSAGESAKPLLDTHLSPCPHDKTHRPNLSSVDWLSWPSPGPGQEMQPGAVWNAPLTPTFFSPLPLLLIHRTVWPYRLISRPLWWHYLKRWWLRYTSDNLLCYNTYRHAHTHREKSERQIVCVCVCQHACLFLFC